MSKDYFYVLSFESTSHAMQTEKQIKQVFEIAMIPTPREITQSCGLSIKLANQDLERIFEFLDGLKVPYGLYRLSELKTDGKRSVSLIRAVEEGRAT